MSSVLVPAVVALGDSSSLVGSELTRWTVVPPWLVAPSEPLFWFCRPVPTAVDVLSVIPGLTATLTCTLSVAIPFGAVANTYVLQGSTALPPYTIESTVFTIPVEIVVGVVVATAHVASREVSVTVTPGDGAAT